MQNHTELHNALAAETTCFQHRKKQEQTQRSWSNVAVQKGLYVWTEKQIHTAGSGAYTSESERKLHMRQGTLLPLKPHIAALLNQCNFSN